MRDFEVVGGDSLRAKTYTNTKLQAHDYITLYNVDSHIIMLYGNMREGEGGSVGVCLNSNH